MNRERLQTMVTILEEVAAGTWKVTDMGNVPKARQREGNTLPIVNFNLHTWGTPMGGGNPVHCGFSACAIGHAILDDRIPELTSDAHIGLSPDYRGAREWEAVEKCFDIGERTAGLLFSPGYYEIEPTPRDVIARINTLLRQ